MPTDSGLVQKSGAAQAAQKVRCLVLDVDGVCTDGKLYFFPDGQVAKCFNAQDGIGIRTAQRLGLEVAVITGRADPCTDWRMRSLGITLIYQGNSDKLAALEDIRLTLGLSYAEMAFLGDDFVDLDPMRQVGLPAAVGDARPQVREEALFVTRAHGGCGAVRELVEFILLSQRPDLDLAASWATLPRK